MALLTDRSWTRTDIVPTDVLLLGGEDKIFALSQGHSSRLY